MPRPFFSSSSGAIVALFCGLVSLTAGHDVVLVCNGANAFCLPLFRLGGARTAINVDGGRSV